jgi:hypothetical protein
MRFLHGVAVRKDTEREPGQIRGAESRSLYVLWPVYGNI